MALSDLLFSNAEAASPARSTLPDVVESGISQRQARPYQGGAYLDSNRGVSSVHAGDYAFGVTLKQDKSYLDSIKKIENIQAAQQQERMGNIARLQNFQKAMADNTINQGIGAAIDLKPAAALVDTWTGSHLAAATPAPLNINERINAIQSLQTKIDGQKEEGGKESIALEQLKMKAEQEREENNAKNLIALQSLGQQNFGTTSANSNKTNPKILNSKEISKFSDNSSARDGITDFMGFIKENPNLMGVLAKAKSKNPFQAYTPEEANMLGKWKEIRQTLGKTLEGGVLRDADWAKYADIIGDINNDPKVAITRLKSLKYELERKYINDYNSFTVGRYDTSGFGDNARKIKIDADERASTQGASDSMLRVNQPSMPIQTMPTSSAPMQSSGQDLVKIRNKIRGL